MLLFLLSIGYFLYHYIFQPPVFSIKPQIKLQNKDDKILALTYFIYGISLFFFVYLDSGELREIDRPSRFILAIPVLILLINSRFPVEWLWYGVVLANIPTFALAYYEAYLTNSPSANGGIVPIMFGDISLMMGIMSLVAALRFYYVNRPVFSLIAVISACMGLVSSILSLSRGGWVAAPFIFVFLAYYSHNLINKKISILAFTAIFSVILISLALPQTGMKPRIDQAINDISSYFDKTKQDGPVGIRLELWKASIEMAKESPILGVGEYHSIEFKKKMVSSGQLQPYAVHYEHAHNEFLDALGLRGLIGLLLLIAIYLVPLSLFLKRIKDSKLSTETRMYAIGGAIIPLCYIFFGLTQSMFSHNIGVMMYAFPILYFWAATKWSEQKTTVK